MHVLRECVDTEVATLLTRQSHEKSLLKGSIVTKRRLSATRRRPKIVTILMNHCNVLQKYLSQLGGHYSTDCKYQLVHGSTVELRPIN